MRISRPPALRSLNPGQVAAQNRVRELGRDRDEDEPRRLDDLSRIKRDSQRRSQSGRPDLNRDLLSPRLFEALASGPARWREVASLRGFA